MLRLSFAQLANLGFAALSNARTLFEDAERLRAAERFTSAYILLGLAADEIGKHILVVAFPTRDASDADWKKFWRRFRAHEEKLGNTLFIDWSLDPFDVDEPPSRKDFHLRRLDATYVDFRDGRVQAPHDFVGADAVDAAHGLVSRQLERCEQFTSRTTPAKLAATMERVHSERLQAASPVGSQHIPGLRNLSTLMLSEEELAAMVEEAAVMFGPSNRANLFKKP
ncbi:AbiV family abortive infection protein [Agromyces endophyticus]|uniref:AbiV family abortive infection protein n=1 Tax=Agromyces sp. H17E-10 TaxID=2932244 RepID=UPI001FD41536|nr:AbiV family abortive infection protein [Agromyces sp. H17E-10]UOQ89178.1 AbiV family abortive infection protein [Agromyces sp. H17E-10]